MTWILLLLLTLVLAAATVILVTQVVELRRENQTFASERTVLNQQITNASNEAAHYKSVASKLHSQLVQYAQFRTLTEAEAYATTTREQAARTLAQAHEEATALREQARQILNSASEQANARLSGLQNEAQSILSGARIEAERLKSISLTEYQEAKRTANSLIATATEQAGQIRQNAELYARNTAADALDAKQNAMRYEQTARAMKNVIEGYGNKYLVPNRSLLDELADDFSHKDAGLQLKIAREQSRSLVATGMAGVCEYSETQRRATAISFVVDAFNGKVEAILSRVRHDNVGTLSQEIRDAFALVNHNGQAFRNACIRNEYLDSRLAELKWAAVAQQMKMDERDEQRRVKEQLREEAKARREYERTLKETEKEEETLRRAMQKAEEQIQRASNEQRQKYEQQLAELQQRLAEAEEKNKRALSMAQQTKRGHVYVISNIGSFGENVYKIGMTRRLEPRDRVRELGDSSVPFEFDVHAMILCDDAPALEKRLHKHFVLNQVNKVNHRKEFFRATIAEIRSELEKLGLETKWTMIAEAMDYRETLAIEKRIATDPELRNAWINRQLHLEEIESRFDGAAGDEDEDE